MKDLKEKEKNSIPEQIKNLEREIKDNKTLISELRREYLKEFPYKTRVFYNTNPNNKRIVIGHDFHNGLLLLGYLNDMDSRDGFTNPFDVTKEESKK